LADFVGGEQPRLGESIDKGFERQFHAAAVAIGRRAAYLRNIRDSSFSRILRILATDEAGASG